MRELCEVSSHGELFVAHDTRNIIQLIPSGFADTHYPQMDNIMSNHGELFVTCDAHDITQLTPSGFAATCYLNMDNIHVAATSSGSRNSLQDMSHMASSGANTLTTGPNMQPPHADLPPNNGKAWATPMPFTQRAERLPVTPERHSARSSTTTAATPGGSKGKSPGPQWSRNHSKLGKAPASSYPEMDSWSPEATLGVDPRQCSLRPVPCTLIHTSQIIQLDPCK